MAVFSGHGYIIIIRYNGMHYTTLLLIVLIATPTFGDHIDLLEEAEDSYAASRKSVSEDLYSLFQIRYPHVTVGRPQIVRCCEENCRTNSLITKGSQ